MATISSPMPRVDGQKLRALMEERFLSHRDLSREAGVSVTTLLNLQAERVEAQRRTVRKLAAALQVEPKDLLKKG
jgi:DNA-binding Xre family transcriptional regulator